MHRLNQLVTPRIQFVVFAILLVALFYSDAPALLSIASVAVSLLGILQLANREVRLLKSPKHLVVVVWVAFLALSVFYTEAPFSKYLNEILFKLTFLGLFVAGSIRKFSARALHVLLLVFSCLAMFVALGTFANYLFHYDEINELIKNSKPIPIITGQNHISFSYMLGFSVLSQLYLWIKRREGANKLPAWLLLTPLVLNFILIHVIAARTGLVAMYIAIGFTVLCYFVLEKKKVVLGLSTVLVLGILSVLAVRYVKPLNERYQNTLRDYSVYFNDENPNWWSGTMRLEAMENAWYIYKEHPIIGVGMADLSTEVKAMYAKRGTLLIEENRINPHNQFMNMMIVGGTIGVGLLLLFFGLMTASAFKHYNWLLLAFMVMSFVGFNLEAFMERQIGSCFFGFFCGLLLQGYFNRK